jgi:hypothetical protein
MGEIEQVLNDLVSEKPLDENEVDTLISILKTAINMYENNTDKI